jgi:hypothetical protein
VIERSDEHRYQDKRDQINDRAGACDLQEVRWLFKEVVQHQAARDRRHQSWSEAPVQTGEAHAGQEEQASHTVIVVQRSERQR